MCEAAGGGGGTIGALGYLFTSLPVHPPNQDSAGETNKNCKVYSLRCKEMDQIKNHDMEQRKGF